MEGRMYFVYENEELVDVLKLTIDEVVSFEFENPECKIELAVEPIDDKDDECQLFEED